MKCKNPGRKIRSKGEGRGLGYGKGEGPIGIPIQVKEIKSMSYVEEVELDGCDTEVEDA